MFYIEGIAAAADLAHARMGSNAGGPDRLRPFVTRGQLVELLHMLEAIGIVKVGVAPVAAAAPISQPIASGSPPATLPPGATVLAVQTLGTQVGGVAQSAPDPVAPPAAEAAAVT